VFENLLVSGLANGGIYALVAMGLVVVYKATTVVNFAHGEGFMLAGFLAYTLYVLVELPYAVALLAAVAGAALMGMLTERIAFRPLLRASVVSLVLATTGFSFLLRGVARQIWGGQGSDLAFPPVFAFQPLQVGDLVLTAQSLVVMAGAVLTMLLFLLFFRYTLLGKMMRATAENQRAAALVGIRVERISAITWGVGVALGGVAAVLAAPLTLLYPDMGGPLLIRAFAAALLGGMGSLAGAVLGGLSLGVIENLAAGYVDTSLTDVAPFLLIILVLLVRPQGLLGRREVVKV
jgi:branched-chain amino acid transport system permease protein